MHHTLMTLIATATNPENSLTPFLNAMTGFGAVMVVTIEPPLGNKPARRLQIIGENGQANPHSVNQINLTALATGQIVDAPTNLPFRVAWIIGHGPLGERIILLSNSEDDTHWTGPAKELRRQELEALGSIVAERLKIQGRHAHLLRMATSDELTGLLNRRAVEIFAPQVIEGARRNGRAVGVLMIDLDHFKSVNDTYGHAGGDAVLKAVADLIKRILRKSDLAIRWGGEEIAIVGEIACSAASDAIKGVRKLAIRVRKGIKSLEIELPSGETITVTASIGGSFFLPYEGELTPAINNADHALYLAKQGGRDCVRTASPE